MRCRWASLLLLAATLFATTPAQAAPSEADRVAARTLLVEGRRKLEAGDAKGALEFFQKAHAIMHVPTTGLDLAKAHAELGQLVEARAAVLEVTQMPAMPGEPAAFTTARNQAKEALEALDERIPSLILRVSGLPLRDIEATVDSQTIPWSELGEPRKMNPGSHEVIVTAPGAATSKQTVTLIEGQTTPVELRIELQPGTGASSKAEGPAWRTTAMWAGAGLSLVSVGLGVGFSAAAAVKNGQMEDEAARLQAATLQGQRICAGLSDPRCATLLEHAEDRDTYWNVAIAGYVVGGLATAGTLVLFLKPDLFGKENRSATIRVLPSLGGLVVTGTY
ncbi:hypothetical protein [Polyangium sp. y55x31]|uniref:hypothetical protein n=1 Tax=Polyangium sp. y55x31 TaxID=3042688 RepID=UPI002482756F|nr:hypothetical protein [Polyangium sp. y55x31]MDI1476403.1 hypothetical protein [Polyangium sp. y55x31]